MLLRQAIENRIACEGEAAARLPSWLKLDRPPTRGWLARRLGGYRAYPVGTIGLRVARARSAAAPQEASGGQRVVVRTSLIRPRLDRAGLASSLARHLAYIGRSDAGIEGGGARLFDSRGPIERPGDAVRSWSDDRHYFRLIISPENGDRIADPEDYVRDLMARVGADLGQEDLAWIGACHHDTAHPHAHVVVRGRLKDGNDLLMPRAFTVSVLRARAEEVAQQRLGDLSRTAPERTIWQATRSNAFTSLDRRLLESANSDGFVAYPVGERDAWGALRRARLAHLEAIGLAGRDGRRYRLAPDLADRLNELWVRLGDARAMNQRRIDAAVETRPLGRARLKGRATYTGLLDRFGTHRFVFVRDHFGVERYARLQIEAAAIVPGRSVSLEGVGTAGEAMLLGPMTAADRTLSL